MTNIEKRQRINREYLSGEFYLDALLREAYSGGLLDESALENVQLQCLTLLADKCARYNAGQSSSIRVETAESIMKAIFYTIGLLLKSLPSADDAVEELKTRKIAELYERGRNAVKTKLEAAKYLYQLVQKNKIDTLNYSYQTTLSEKGLGLFFKAYNLDYAAHECPALIDYQLCNAVTDLAGIEFMQKYLERLYLENDFCRNFETKAIHHLLYGYDAEYQVLLINIFEQVLTAALGCVLAKRNVRELQILRDDCTGLYKELSQQDAETLRLKIWEATEKLCEELKIKSPALQKYLENSLPKITAAIVQALKMNTLERVFISSVNPDLKPVIYFAAGEKMEDADYRELIEELLRCRHAADKIALIKEKVKSFADLEDTLLDAQLEEEELISVLATLGDVELAEMLRRHPDQAEVQAVDLSETEQTMQLCLKKYLYRLAVKRRKRIFTLVNQLTDEPEMEE